MGLFESLAGMLVSKATVPSSLVRPTSPPVPLQARSRGPTTASVLGTLPLSMQIQRVGGAISPAQVSTIIRQADTGSMWRLMDLANDMRQKDSHLQSVLGTRETAVASLDWTIDAVLLPGAEKPTPKHVEQARSIKHGLEQATGVDQDVRSFTDLLAHLNGAPYYGYAISEIDWTVKRGMQVPLGFRNKPARRFRYRENDGRLVWFDEGAGTSTVGNFPTSRALKDAHGLLGLLQGLNNSSGVDLAEDFPNKFIQHQPRVNGDVAAREGLVRVLMWAVLFRNWDIADWMKLAELAWKPWRVGIYKKNDYPSQEDRDGLLDILEQMIADGIAVLPDNVKLDVMFPQNSGQGAGGVGNHQALAEFMSGEMSKAVLGQTLTTEAGKRGARSLGEIHDRVRRDIRDGDAKAVASTINCDLVRPMHEMNHGAADPQPMFRFLTEDVADLGELMTAIKTGVDAGARIPERWVHDRAGVPIPKDGERIIGGFASDDPPPPPPGDNDDEVDVDLDELDDEAA